MGVVFGTVISGVLVFVASQVFMKLVLDPIDDQRRAIAEVTYRMIYFANAFVGGPFSPSTQEASTKLREASSRLWSTTGLIRGYETWRKIGLVTVPRADVENAAAKLMGLSNTTGDRPDDGNDRRGRRDEIASLLKIPNPS